MKKYLLLGLLISIVPNICLGYGARYTQLVREKERKMAELEKCTGSTKGLKIAGISTLGLTAVGVAGNVVEAKKIKDYDNKIKDVPKQMEKLNKDIAKADKEMEEVQNCTNYKNGKCLDKFVSTQNHDNDNNNTLERVVKKDIEAINNTEAVLGAEIYIHGYGLGDIDSNQLKKMLEEAIADFKARCEREQPENSVTTGILEEAQGANNSKYYKENTVLPSREQHTVMKCECDSDAWEQKDNRCVKKQ